MKKVLLFALVSLALPADSLTHLHGASLPTHPSTVQGVKGEAAKPFVERAARAAELGVAEAMLGKGSTLAGHVAKHHRQQPNKVLSSFVVDPFELSVTPAVRIDATIAGSHVVGGAVRTVTTFPAGAAVHFGGAPLLVVSDDADADADADAGNDSEKAAIGTGGERALGDSISMLPSVAVQGPARVHFGNGVGASSTPRLMLPNRVDTTSDFSTVRVEEGSDVRVEGAASVSLTGGDHRCVFSPMASRSGNGDTGDNADPFVNGAVADGAAGVVNVTVLPPLNLHFSTTTSNPGGGRGGGDPGDDQVGIGNTTAVVRSVTRQRVRQGGYGSAVAIAPRKKGNGSGEGKGNSTPSPLVFQVPASAFRGLKAGGAKGRVVAFEAAAGAIVKLRADATMAADGVTTAWEAVVFVRSQGEAEVMKVEKVTPNTVISVQGVSKNMTTPAVQEQLAHLMRLAEENAKMIADEL